MEETQTIHEVAHALGLSPVTVQEWADTLWPGDALRDASGRQRLTLEQVRILEILSAMKGEDKGINTITRIIGPIQFQEAPAVPDKVPTGLLEERLRRLQRENQQLKQILMLPWWRLAIEGKKRLLAVLTQDRS